MRGVAVPEQLIDDVGVPQQSLGDQSRVWLNHHQRTHKGLAEILITQLLHTPGGLLAIFALPKHPCLNRLTTK